jgi:hypothetical protein
MARDLQHLERDARDAIAATYGHSLSDEEWAAAKYALLELGKLLRDWSKLAKESSAA